MPHVLTSGKDDVVQRISILSAKDEVYGTGSSTTRREQRSQNKKTKSEMSHERLSNCSGSITGKEKVRALTHSQALGSACERRESKESVVSLRLLLCPGVFCRVLVGGNGKNKKQKNANSSRRGQNRNDSWAME